MCAKTLGIAAPACCRRSPVCPTVVVLSCLAASALLASEWQSVPLADGDILSPDAGLWRPYRGAKLEKVSSGPGGTNVLRVTVAENEQGGFSLIATPRGGMGNRVRMTVTYRVVSGSPVSIYVGTSTPPPGDWLRQHVVLHSPAICSLPSSRLPVQTELA